MVVSLSKLKAGFSLPPPPPPVSSASLSDGNTWRPGNIRRSVRGLLSEVEVTSDDDRDGRVHQLCLLLLLPLHHVHELSLDDVLPPAPELSVVLAVQLRVLREGGEEGGLDWSGSHLVVVQTVLTQHHAGSHQAQTGLQGIVENSHF